MRIARSTAACLRGRGGTHTSSTRAPLQSCVGRRRRQWPGYSRGRRPHQVRRGDRDAWSTCLVAFGTLFQGVLRSLCVTWCRGIPLTVAATCRRQWGRSERGGEGRKPKTEKVLKNSTRHQQKCKEKTEKQRAQPTRAPAPSTRAGEQNKRNSGNSLHFQRGPSWHTTHCHRPHRTAYSVFVSCLVSYAQKRYNWSCFMRKLRRGRCPW